MNQSMVTIESNRTKAWSSERPTANLRFKGSKRVFRSTKSMQYSVTSLQELLFALLTSDWTTMPERCLEFSRTSLGTINRDILWDIVIAPWGILWNLLGTEQEPSDHRPIILFCSLLSWAIEARNIPRKSSYFLCSSDGAFIIYTVVEWIRIIQQGWTASVTAAAAAVCRLKYEYKY